MQDNGNGGSKVSLIVMLCLACVLVICGLVIVICSLGQVAGQPVVIDILGFKFEGNDVGLVLVFFGMFLLWLVHKERSDIRKYETLRSKIDKTIDLARNISIKFAEQRLAEPRVSQTPKADKLKDLVEKARTKGEEEATTWVKLQRAKEIMDLSGEID